MGKGGIYAAESVASEEFSKRGLLPELVGCHNFGEGIDFNRKSRFAILFIPRILLRWDRGTISGMRKTRKTGREIRNMSLASQDSGIQAGLLHIINRST